MGWLRASLRLIALAAWMLVCVPLHLLTRMTRQRSNWPRRFLRGVGWILGARVRVTGAPLAPGTLALANHVSWLDIIILAGASGTAFVSKAEIKMVPLVGWLADQNHTVYVERADRRGVRGQVAAVERALGRPFPITVFPEGTTSDGTGMLPFRTTLIAAAGETVRPIAIDYGEAAPAIAWKDEPALDNVRMILRRRGPLDVRISLLAPLPPGLDRKALARDARQAIAAHLARP